MVEERSAKGGLKELIRDGVLRMARLMQVLIDRKVLRLVHAHAEADGVATGDVAILLAAVQLVLLLVVAVDQVLRAASGKSRPFGDTIGVKGARSRACGIGGVDEVVNVEWLVREVAAEGRAGRHIGAARRLRWSGEVDVVLLQTGVGHPALTDLDGVGAIGPAEAIDALPAAIEVVEAVILLVDDHDVVDGAKRRRGGRRSCRR